MEGNRPKRTTRPPAWHTDMAALPSTSSDDADRQMIRSSRPFFQLDLSELRATVEERITIGGGDKSTAVHHDIARRKNDNYETEQIMNDGQDDVRMDHVEYETEGHHDVYDDRNENEQLNDGYETLNSIDRNDDGHETGQMTDGDKTEQLNNGYETQKAIDRDDDGHETGQMTDGDETEKLNDDYETQKSIDRDDDGDETEQMTDGNRTRTMSATEVDPPTPETSGCSDPDIRKLLVEMRKMKRMMKEKFETWEQNFLLIRDFIEGQQQSSAYPTKPDCLPMKSIGDLEAFEHCTKEAHREVIQYLHNMGGSDTKNCANIMMKEAIHDKLALKINYYGRHQGTFALENTKFSRTLYKAMCRTLGRDTIPLTEFSAAMMTALRAAKQRRRNAKERRRNRAAQNPGDALV